MQNRPKDTILIDGFRFRKYETNFFNDLFFDEEDILFCCLLHDCGRPLIVYNRKLSYKEQAEKLGVILEVTSEGISVDSVMGTGWVSVSNNQISESVHYDDWRLMIRDWIKRIKEDWCYVHRELLINKIEK